LEINPLSLF